MQNKVVKIIAVLIFSALLIIPATLWVSGAHVDIKSNENRALAIMPDFNPANLDPFPSGFDSWFTDHFPLRNRFTQLYSYIQIKWFGISPLPEKCMEGKEGWLYIMNEEYNTYAGSDMLSNATIEKYVLRVKARDKWLKSKGCRYYYVVAPVKYSVYPEFVPTFLQRNPSLRRTDQILNALNEAGIATIDLRKSLLEGKTKGDLPVFRKLDNHWNGVGGYYATSSLVERIGVDFPQILPVLPLDSFDIKREYQPNGNIASMMTMRDQYNDSTYTFTCKTRKPVKDVSRHFPVTPGFPYPWEFEREWVCKGRPEVKCLIITDSFGGKLRPVLPNYFSNTIHIFDSWCYGLNRNIVEKELPDVFIQMQLECKLENLLTKNKE